MYDKKYICYVKKGYIIRVGKVPDVPSRRRSPKMVVDFLMFSRPSNSTRLNAPEMETYMGYESPKGSWYHPLNVERGRIRCLVGTCFTNVVPESVKVLGKIELDDDGYMVLGVTLNP